MNLLVSSAFHMQVRDCAVFPWLQSSVLWRLWAAAVESEVKVQLLTLRVFCLCVCRQSWLVVCAILATSLLASLAGNLIQTCRKCKARKKRADYSYLPLGEINGAAERGRGQGTRSGKVLFQQEDSDSQGSS